MDELQNSVLRVLRGIRGKLDEHDRGFDEADRRFDKLDRTLETIRFQITQPIGLAMTASLTTTDTDRPR